MQLTKSNDGNGHLATSDDGNYQLASDEDSSRHLVIEAHGMSGDNRHLTIGRNDNCQLAIDADGYLVPADGLACNINGSTV